MGYPAGGREVEPAVKAAIFNLWGTSDPRGLGGEETPAVLTLLGGAKGFLFGKVGQGLLRPPVGYFLVYANGRPRGVLDENGDLMTPEDLADRIKRHRHYRPGQHVILASCFVGQGPFPQRLANRLVTDVIASPERVLALLGTMTTVAVRRAPIGHQWLRWSPGREPPPVPRNFDPDGWFSTGVEG